jgi:hypothetical protein
MPPLSLSILCSVEDRRKKKYIKKKKERKKDPVREEKS